MNINAASISALAAQQTAQQIDTAVLKKAQNAAEAEGAAVVELLEATAQLMSDLDSGEIDVTA